jgi:hypothetical protein
MSGGKNKDNDQKLADFRCAFYRLPQKEMI